MTNTLLARLARGTLLAACVLFAPLVSQADPAPGVETADGYTAGQDVGVHKGMHSTTEAYVGGMTMGDTHRYWLKFDLSFLPSDVDEIVSAELVLTAGRKSLLPIGVARASDAWDAGDLVWTTQPAFGTPTGTVEYLYEAGKQYAWDVKNHVEDELAGGDGALSMVLLQSPEGTKTGNVWFFTDAMTGDGDARRPTLRVCYTRGGNEPPVVTVGAPHVLCPPNHKMHELHLGDLATASDPDQGALDLGAYGRILSIRSDEPADAAGGGDGHTAVDIEILGPATFAVRCERAGAGNGRVYVVRFAVSDDAGAEVEAEARIEVPRDKRGAPAVDDGAAAGHTVSAE